METMNHSILVNSDIGTVDYLPWSCSRMQTAASCLDKFKRIYLDDMKESSPALTLGSLTHEIIADLLGSNNPSMDTVDALITKSYAKYKDYPYSSEAFKEVRVFSPYILEFKNTWDEFRREKGITKQFIEHPYGLNRLGRELVRAPNIDGYNRSYIRGIIDLWAYDSNTQTLYVIDHKTSKSAKSSNKVKEDTQLNLYVSMLSSIYKMPWKEAYIALNFIRRKKIVWAKVTPKETDVFTDLFLNSLDYLEYRIIECESSLVWPASKTFQCNMCSFKNTCTTYNMLV